MSFVSKCPACKNPMTEQELASVVGSKVEIDLCFACRGIWFDPQENLKLAPAAVLSLFRQLHEHRFDAARALPDALACPHCARTLVQGFDVVKSGRYITHRCPQRHGRFSTFASFMIEKGFVRQLTAAEIDDMARRLGVINCSNCGAPVDLRKEHACPYCHTALSLLDPQAVGRALQGYARAAERAGQVSMPDLADALVMLERDRQRAQRQAQASGGADLVFSRDIGVGAVDLWAVGLGLVDKLLN